MNHIKIDSKMLLNSRKNSFYVKQNKEYLFKIKNLKSFLKSVENCKENLKVEDYCLNSNDCTRKSIISIGKDNFHSNEIIKCECPVEKSYLCKDKYCTSDKFTCDRFHNLDSTIGIKSCNNSKIIETKIKKINYKYRF
jgi:hypothetical protein